MRSFLSAIQSVAIILGIFVLHIVFAYAAPYPLYELHVMYLFLVWLLIRNKKSKALWLVLVFGYLTELFSSEYFGVHTLTLLVSVITVSWLLEKVFTNHAWYIIAVLGLCATLIQRLLFILIRFGSHGFKNATFSSTGNIFQEILIEVVINMVGLLVVYSISNLFYNRTNPRYV